MSARIVKKSRETAETKIEVEINIDGSGRAEVETGVPFFDHMLEQLIRHSGFDIVLKADGDLEIDEHHTVEDTAILLGQACKVALGDKKGIARFGDALVPMDESLVRTAVDWSGRGYLYADLPFSRASLGGFSLEMVEEFLQKFSLNAGLTLHVELLHGKNSHHQVEAVFKSIAIALAKSVQIVSEQIPSTKGVL